MVDPTTSNIQLAVPTRGSDTGTWDVPVNGNMTILDAAEGGILTIGLNNTNVILSSAQFIYKQIVFNSTLTANVTITFPSTFIKTYEIFNACTGIGSFTIQLQAVSSSTGQVVCCPPGECVDVYNDGTNIKFKSLARVGAYWDYAGSSVPSWVSGCTVPPYLNCDGTTFSATTYPTLSVILGSTTLPDARGRSRFVLDQGTGRNGLGVVGGSSGTASTTLGTGNLPAYTPSGSVSVNSLNLKFSAYQVVGGAGANLIDTTGGGGTTSGAFSAASVSFSGNAQGGTSTPFTNLPPSYAGGLTLIRAG